MTKFGRDAAAEDIGAVLKFKGAIFAHAAAHGLSPALVAAIISRETRANPGLSIKGTPPGRFVGDGGHGCGPMQVDDGARNGKHGPNFDLCERYRQGKATDDELIEVGCQILATKIRIMKDLRAGVAAYNCGEGNVAAARRMGADIDSRTAFHNYSADVLNREAFFAESGFEV